MTLKAVVWYSVSPHTEWQVYTTTTKKAHCRHCLAWRRRSRRHYATRRQPRPLRHGVLRGAAQQLHWCSLASLSLFCDKILLLSCSQLAQYATTTFLSLCIIMSPCYIVSVLSTNSSYQGWRNHRDRGNTLLTSCWHLASFFKNVRKKEWLTKRSKVIAFHNCCSWEEESLLIHQVLVL